MILNQKLNLHYENQLNKIKDSFKKFGKISIIDKNKTFDSTILNKDINKQESIIN